MKIVKILHFLKINSLDSGAYVPISSVGLFSLITKTINPSSAPIRVRFKLDTDLQAITGQVTIILPSNQYEYTSPNVARRGYFRTYTSEVDFIQKEIYSIAITGSLTSGYTITAKPVTPLAANVFHELVVFFEQLPGSSSHFNKISADNKRFLAYFDNAGIVFAREAVPIYVYRSSPIPLAGLQYTSSSVSDNNTLILSFTVNFAISTFPTSIIEIEFPSANHIVIKSGLTYNDRQFSCGIIGLEKRTTSVENPRCIWVPSHIPKIRIENYAAHTIGTSFDVILYDLLNSVVSKNSVNALDLLISYLDQNLRSKSRLKLTRAFITTPGPAVLVTDLMSMTASPPYYGAISTLTQNIIWPAGMSCTFCRLVVRSSGWDWKFKGDFKFHINGAEQTIYRDLASNSFGMFFHIYFYNKPLSCSVNDHTTYSFNNIYIHLLGSQF